MTDYVQLAEFDTYCRDEFGAVESNLRLRSLKDAERSVNKYCHRSFVPVAADATPTARLYVATGTQVLRIHDCRSVTAITVDGAALSASDYQLEPYAVSWDGLEVPYEQVRLLNSVWLTSTPGAATISVTARWGWAATPDEVPATVLALGKNDLDIRSGAPGMTEREMRDLWARLAPLRRVEAFGVA